MARTAGARVVPLGLVLGLLAVLTAPRAAPAQEVRYFYDALNRLVGVMDPQGNGAEYLYDAVGNLLQIRRFTATVSGTVAILLVRPIQGTAHTPVEIYGRGFSAVPAENQVAFNGTAATVTAATDTHLLTSVPAGATTGPLTVTTPLGSATAPDPFTVLAGFGVVPDQADVALGATLGFQAILDGNPTTAVTWRVNGTAGGSALVGTITATGVYTAPSTPPPVPTITVEAVRTADPAWVAPATVRLDQPGGTLAARPVSVGAPVDTAQAVAGGVSVRGPQAVGAHAVAAPVAVSTNAVPGGLVIPPRVSVGPGVPLVGGRVAVTRGPVILTVAPATAPRGSTNLALTLTGGNFQGATAVRFLRDGTADTTLTVAGVTPAANGTSVTLTLTIGGTAPLGVRAVQVVTPQGTSTAFDLGTNRFTVTAP